MPIPLDAYLVTLRITSSRTVERTIQVGRGTQIRRERVQETRDVPPRQDARGIAQAMTRANEIWAPAGISFSVRSTTARTVSLPGDSDVVAERDFAFLARQCPPSGNGASVLFVSRFAGTEGGMAVENMKTCIVASLGHPLTGETLAHEFGHLLSLQHPRDPTGANYNLMYPALRAGHNLSAPQISQALASSLAQTQAGQAAQRR